MIIYSYPAGAVVNGRLLETRELLPAGPCTIGDVHHGPNIFTNWDPAELTALGIKSFTEDVVPQYHHAGAHVDVEDATSVRRTYPNACLDEDCALAAALAEIDAKYEAKFAPVKDLIIVTLAADGPDMEDSLASLRADWQRLCASRCAEIDELLMELP
jgi:hypothetical protein